MTGTQGLTTIDGVIVLIYIAAIVMLGFLLSHRRASASEFFLASHGARWPVIGLSLVASNISPTALIGITGSAYAIGISVYDYEWMAAVVLTLFALIFLPIVLRSGVYTIPEFLERRYDGRARLWFAGLTLLLTMLLDAAGALYGGTLLLQIVLPSLALWQGIILLAVLGGAYALTGGLRAVMYTEALQGMIVFGSALVLAVLTIRHAGGLEAVLRAAPPEKLSLIRPATDAYMPWTGLVFGAPILGFYFWCTNQFMVQRMLAARSIVDGQKGAILAGFLKLATLFVIVLPGIAALQLYPGLARSDQAYPKLLFDLMPSGLVGLLLAAFFGALMAQLSATYNSAATLISMDFVRHARPDLDGRRLVHWGRIATVGCMALSILWAPQIDRFPSLWQYLQAVMAYTTPPVVALFVIGTLWPRANATGAIAAITIGSGLGAALFALSVAGIFEVQFLLVAALVFAASAVALVVASLASPPPEIDAIAELLAFRHQGRARPAGQAMVRWGAAALLLMTAPLVFLFR